MLAAASIILCLFLVFQFRKGQSAPLLGKSGGLKNDMKLDPLVEGKSWALSSIFMPCCASMVLIDEFLVTGEPPGRLWRADNNDYAPDSPNSARTNAAIISLVRNEEVYELLPTMRDVERTFNSKFNYPWIFFNDKPFTEEFKVKTQAETKAKCLYGRAALLTCLFSIGAIVSDV